MDREEYAKWVEYAVNTKKGIVPREQVEDYDKWRSKFDLAQYLSIVYEEHEPALKLLESILKEDLVAFKEKEGITYQEFIELKIITLESIGDLSWILYEDSLKAYHYISEALELAEFVDYKFESVLRGRMWSSQLYHLGNIKDDQLVRDKIEDRINYHLDHYSHGSNSYLYYGYSMLASMEWASKDKEQECIYYKKSLDYFPLNDDEKIKLEEIWASRHNDYRKAANEIYLLAARHKATRDWDL